MHTGRRIVFFLLAAVWAASCTAPSRTDRTTRQQLDELDRLLATKDLYVAKKKDQLNAYRRLISATEDPAGRYEL